MVYAISDLHGRYDLYKKMLDKLSLKDDDKLYILGDLIDRGPDGIEIIKDAFFRNNVEITLGNHDATAAIMLEKFVINKGADHTEKDKAAFEMWLSDGGQFTYDAFLKLSDKDQTAILFLLKQLPLYKEITVGDNKFLLCHTVSVKEDMENLDDCGFSDFVWGEPEYELCYYPDRYVVTGHTPTKFIDENYTGRIYKANRHIAIDCGAVFYGTLGCICLDDMSEIYVD